MIALERMNTYQTCYYRVGKAVVQCPFRSTFCYPFKESANAGNAVFSGSLSVIFDPTGESDNTESMLNRSGLFSSFGVLLHICTGYGKVQMRFSGDVYITPDDPTILWGFPTI